MSALEWIAYILFNIAINVVFQTLAWKIAYKISDKQTKRRFRND